MDISCVFFMYYGFFIIAAREKKYKQKTIQFNIFKTNRDTIQVISQLAYKLYLKPSNFAFAGIIIYSSFYKILRYKR